MNNKVDYRFKILYAIGMLMVVAGHCNGGGIPLDIAGWFPYYGFHLSLFAFASGYFYKSSYENNVIRYIIKKTKSLIVPLYIYTFAYGIIVTLSHLAGFTIGWKFTLYNLIIAPVTNGHQFFYNMGGWFVVPLFMVEIANIIFRKVVRSIIPIIPEYIFFIISLFIGLIGNSLAANGYNIDLWLVLTRFTYFFPFFSLGIFYKKTLEKYEQKIPNSLFFITIFGVKLFIIMYYGKNITYTPSWCNDFTEGAAMPIIIGILGIALWMRISTILEPIFWKSRLVNLIANNTYSIMMNQFLGFMILKTFFAILSSLSFLKNFDWQRYKTDIWYYYLPGSIEQTLTLYLISGILFPILLQYIINSFKQMLLKLIILNIPFT